MLAAFGLLLLLPFAAGNFHQFENTSASNIPSVSSGFRISRFLQDGEFERVTIWPGFCAKETSVDWGQIDVTLREVWLEKEKRKLELIYEGGTLSDCFDEKIKAEDDAANHVAENCLSELGHSKKLKKNEKKENREGDQGDEDVSIQLISQEDFSSHNVVSWFVSAEELRDQCFRVRTRTRNQVLARQGQSRFTRGIIPNFLFAPGTKWCGPTQLASSYNELGAFDQLDRCCRRHDHCHRAIPPMTQRYAFYNYLPFTLSHCGCDQSFRTCLKMAGTSSANFVGKLFFNVVQTKCFVLKPQKTCVQRSWRGKCEIHEYRKQAYLRNNVPY